MAGRADTVELTIVDRRDAWPRPPRGCCWSQALVKGDRGELAVELATEAGVDGIVPWRAVSLRRPLGRRARGAKALARWRSTVREAAKQARRPWVPQVEEPVAPPSWRTGSADAAGGLVLHEGAADPLAAASLPGGAELIMVVGPEGGITEAELDELVDGRRAGRCGSARRCCGPPPRPRWRSARCPC